MAKQLKAQDLIKIIDDEISLSTTYNNKISKERAKALKYYNKEPYGNEKKGRSTYVSSETQETVSWSLPQIMKIFASEDVVQFDPEGPGKEINAELATEYCKYILHKKNNGFLILHNFFHDALLQKNGVIKVYYDNTPELAREEYRGLSDIELTQLLQDEAVEPIEHETAEGDIDPLTGQSTQLHDLTIKRKKTRAGKIKIENIPPEELVVSRRTRSLSLNDAPFVAHRVKKTISWLREQGYKIPDDITDGTEAEAEYSSEKVTREFQDGVYTDQLDGSNLDPAQRQVWVVEAYFRVDFDGDGISEYRKVTKVGSRILSNDEVFTQPFIATSPFPLPHKFNGQSMADLVMDLQLLKSMLMRAMLDSFAFNINPSKAVDITKVIDVNDLLDTNPGNYIRMRGDINNSFFAMPTSGVGAETFQLLEYVDNIAESRSGVSRMTQGIDANVFNKTATGTQAIMSASQEKIALIVRIFAETGVGELYKKIIQLASNYATGPELIQINSEFAEVNPKEWTNLETISVCVGTGALDKQVELTNINQLIQLQQALASSNIPEAMALISPVKVYNSLASLAKAMGYKNVDKFFNNPVSVDYQQAYQSLLQKSSPPPDPMVVAAQLQAQSLQQKNEQEMLIKTADFELEKLKADREFELQKIELQLKYETELAKLQQRDEMERMKLQLNDLASLDPGNGLLPPSEIAAIQDVAQIQQKHSS
ncbi:portal protein [Methylobacter sp.]|uniref:portal protein n=1 Tax=Methylobacter sp. TaxID=2051955 RepID=UPI003DA56BE2